MQKATADGTEHLDTLKTELENSLKDYQTMVELQNEFIRSAGLRHAFQEWIQQEAKAAPVSGPDPEDYGLEEPASIWEAMPQEEPGDSIPVKPPGKQTQAERPLEGEAQTEGLPKEQTQPEGASERKTRREGNSGLKAKAL